VRALLLPPAGHRAPQRAASRQQCGRCSVFPGGSCTLAWLGRPTRTGLASQPPPNHTHKTASLRRAKLFKSVNAHPTLFEQVTGKVRVKQQPAGGAAKAGGGGGSAAAAAGASGVQRPKPAFKPEEVRRLGRRVMIMGRG